MSTLRSRLLDHATAWRRLPYLGAALVLATAALPAAAAGTVTVRWSEPERFADVGQGSLERERVLDDLAQHWQSMGRLLPDGQTLAVEVTDLNLAGELLPHAANPVRVLRGRADWPTMTLRYTLSAGAQVLRQGDARLSDMHYFMGRVRPEALAYEKRMIERWMRDELLPAR